MRNESRQPRSGTYKITAINIDKEILDLYRRKSLEYDRSVSYLANMALREYANKHFNK